MSLLLQQLKQSRTEVTMNVVEQTPKKPDCLSFAVFCDWLTLWPAAVMLRLQVKEFLTVPLSVIHH